MPPEPKDVRCAIYTRKSTEEGLEQEFNSLDAQREAGAAYIASQKHEGWRQLPDIYDDGAFSGGNMERPALQRLLAEVRAGRVDVIVVYKVDRLTRSLADFAKIIEVLDAAGASFVSVTQAFSTTTSMGRLTLNVLLSFAQFEREVTGERIRDKIAASKKKGMWMGGPVPLGYDVRDRHLVVNEVEAETVRHIYRRYLELGSAPAVIEALAADGVRTKVQVRTSGPHRGGISFARGSLYHLLRNRIYLGEIIHKGASYPGDHEAIVPADLWEAVQTRMDQGIRRYRRRDGARQRSLLAGLAYDEHGRRMTPSHATKAGKRYRYYITPSKGGDDRKGMRLPAHDLEQIVVGKVRQWLSDAGSLCAAIDHATDASGLAAALARAADYGAKLGHSERCRDGVSALVERVQVFEDRAEIGVNLEAVQAGGGATTLTTPVFTIRSGHEVRLLVAAPTPAQEPPNNDNGIMLAEAVSVREQLLASSETIAAFARRTGRCRGHVASLVRWSFLAPELVRHVISAERPSLLDVDQGSSLPLSWNKQRRRLS